MYDSLSSIFKKLVGMSLPFTSTLIVLLHSNTHLFLFPELLLSLLFWHCVRPNFSFLSAASNDNLKPGDFLKWKKRLVKDIRIFLPLNYRNNDNRQTCISASVIAKAS